MTDARIVSVRGRRVWDSRGRPTVEAEVRLAGGAIGRAISPAGASTGSGEALDLRDGGKAFGGFDVKRAVGHVNGEIAKSVTGCDAADQAVHADHSEAAQEGAVGGRDQQQSATVGHGALVRPDQLAQPRGVAELGTGHVHDHGGVPWTLPLQENRPQLLNALLAFLFWEPAHFIMQLRQLSNLKRRAEGAVSRREARAEVTTRLRTPQAPRAP